MSVIASRLHQFSFEEQIAEASSRQQRDAAGRADLIRGTAVSDKLEGRAPRVLVPTPGLGVGELQLLEDSIVFEVRLPLKRKPLGDISGVFVVGTLRATDTAQKKHSQCEPLD